jgi:hypothetical protein
MVNNPEKPAKRLFAEEWKEAWKKLEEHVRHRPGPHLLMALAIGYLLQIVPVRSLLVLAGKLCLMLDLQSIDAVCVFHQPSLDNSNVCYSSVI